MLTIRMDLTIEWNAWRCLLCGKNSSDSFFLRIEQEYIYAIKKWSFLSIHKNCYPFKSLLKIQPMIMQRFSNAFFSSSSQTIRWNEAKVECVAIDPKAGVAPPFDGLNQTWCFAVIVCLMMTMRLMCVIHKVSARFTQ